MRIQSLANIGVGRSRRGIKRAHAPITDSRDQHGKERDQNDGDEVAVRQFLRHSIQGHRRNRLDQYDSVKNQIPKRERATQARYGTSSGSRRFHGNGY
jgi:hypothetical protein